MSVSFECVTRSEHSAVELFDLARDIDAHLGSQADAGERAVAGVISGLIGLGEDVTWKARHLGVRFTMTSRVTAFERPHRFVDEQIRGPFRSFRHEHVFEPDDDDAGCVMIDRIRFEAPFGPLGRLVERVLLERYLRRLIEDRGRYLAAGG